MIEFVSTAPDPGSARLTLAAGNDLDDALAQFGRLDDCLGCSTVAAAPPWTPESSIERVLKTFSPLAGHGPVIRPDSGPAGLFRRSDHWTEVDIDAGAQRLHSVKMPAALIDAQRLIAIDDVRGIDGDRPVVALGLWTLFAHPVVRAGARFAGARDGLIAEIALTVHPDRYVIIDSERPQGLTFVIATADPIAADLMVLALRQGRARVRGAGPWEDPLVQAATELDLGARTFDQIDIDAVISPTLSPDRRELTAELLTVAAELIGVRRSA
jgi:hypothetical protein